MGRDPDRDAACEFNDENENWHHLWYLATLKYPSPSSSSGMSRMHYQDRKK